MATTYLKLRGKIKWPQNITELDDYKGAKFWKVNMYDLDAQSQEDFKQSGCQVKPYRDKDGDEMLTFRRYLRKVIKDEMVEFEPPELEGTENGVVIGNGSEAEVTIDVYDTMQGKGHRLRSVKITKLVPYEAANTPVAQKVEEEPIDKSAFE
jgi:hypothetical protein